MSTVTVTAIPTGAPNAERLIVKGFVFSPDGLRSIMVDVEITDPLTIAEITRDTNC